MYVFTIALTCTTFFIPCTISITIMTDVLTFCSLNVRGLGDHSKRALIFKHLRDIKSDVVLLQETHNTNKTNKLWKTQWGGEWINSYGTSNARGVAIIFNPRVQNKISFKHVNRDEAGRIVVLTLSYQDQNYTVANIYGENTDNPALFSRLSDIIQDRNNEHIVIGGDFNFVLNDQLDSYNRNISHVGSRAVTTQLIEDLELVDIWRITHPDTKCYTWHKTNPSPVFSRLDFFLISSSLLTNTHACKIHNSPRTDHSAVTLSIFTDLNERGPGVWKMNNTLLNNATFLEELKLTIKNCADITSDLNGHDQWEQVKYAITQFCRMYSKKAAKLTRLEINNKQKSVNYLINELLNNSNKKEIINDSLKSLRKDIEEDLDAKARGIIFRSKAKWIKEGEKNTKYFLAWRREITLPKI